MSLESRLTALATRIGQEIKAVRSELVARVPTGVGMEWYTNTPPSGWLIQDGSEQPIATYTTLYNVLTANGTTFPFGANTNGSGGAGSTHFRLPNRKGRVGVGRDAAQTEFDVLGETGGAKTHTLSIGELPSHDHGGTTAGSVSGTSGYNAVPEAYYTATYGLSQVAGYQGRPMVWTNSYEANHSHTIPASGGGGAHNNLQPYTTVNFIIKT